MSSKFVFNQILLKNYVIYVCVSIMKNEEVYSPRRQHTIITVTMSMQRQICTLNIV